jgi:hypothetical protein
MARIVSPVREGVSKYQIIFEPTEMFSAVPLAGGPKGWHASRDSKASIVTGFLQRCTPLCGLRDLGKSAPASTRTTRRGTKSWTWGNGAERMVNYRSLCFSQLRTRTSRPRTLAICSIRARSAFIRSSRSSERRTSSIQRPRLTAALPRCFWRLIPSAWCGTGADRAAKLMSCQIRP